MAIKEVTVSGPTLDYAIKKGLDQIGLSQTSTYIRILQKDSQSVFGHKEAIVTIAFDEDESKVALAHKTRSEFKTKFKFLLKEGKAFVQVPSSFYEPFYLPSKEDREKYLREFLKEQRVETPDEEAVQRLITDFHCQYELVAVKTFDCDPLDEKGGLIYLSVSADALLAEAIIFPGSEELEEGAIFKALKKRSIIKGVMLNHIRQALKTRFIGYFEVARGKAPVDDAIGRIEKFFQEDEHKEFTKMMELLTIDTRNIKEINIADRNQLLLQVGDVVIGEDGYTVDGRILKKKELGANEKGVKLGGNVQISDDGRSVYATESGHIVWKPDEKFIDIEPMYIVEGNVDFSEGNIVGFVGKVLIKGDVKPKFTVSAEGDVEIRGSVEDATVESLRGNVFIAGSVVHKRQGMIKAKETVHCALATNADLRAKRIVIEKECLNSHVEAEESIEIVGNPGAVIGGELIAKQLIRVNILGSENGVKTKVHVGDVTELKKRLRTLMQKLNLLANQLKETQQILAILETKKQRSKLSAGQEEQLQKVLQEIPGLEDAIQFGQQDENLVRAEIQKQKSARLEILKTLHAQVDIYCFEAYYIPPTKEAYVGFKCQDGEIKRYQL
ncbi:MAG: polymerase [Chlamydiales bacterium]|jgi:uncharacterized protein (DUF342 family)|nr:polymerase [Chlamydiales bacterium]